MFDIENCPAKAWNYEFIVCEVRNDKLIFNSYHKSGGAADTVASHLNNGVVVHNVRIQGYREPKREKLYTFHGTWSWSCWAESEEKAIQKYKDEAYPEELDINFYDYISEEEDE